MSVMFPGASASLPIPMPIFEPELSFLPYACAECGSRVPTEADLALHRREICPRRAGASSRFAPAFVFELPGGNGIADGGRRT
jgi:hypothetical protein